MRIQIYLTATLAAVPVAVAAILAATPIASPANVQLSFNAALRNAPLVEVDPPQAPCRWPVSGGVASSCERPGLGDPGRKRPSGGSPGPAPNREQEQNSHNEPSPAGPAPNREQEQNSHNEPSPA